MTKVTTARTTRERKRNRHIYLKTGASNAYRYRHFTWFINGTFFHNRMNGHATVCGLQRITYHLC